MAGRRRKVATVDPLGGWPRTRRRTRKDGQPELRMEGLILTPGRAKFGDTLLVLLTIGGIIVIFGAAPPDGAPAEDAFAGGVLLSIFWGAVMLVMYGLRPFWLSRRLTVVMDPEHMRVGRKSYDRGKIAQWAYALHDRATEEEAAEAEAQYDAALKGRKIRRKRKYYRKSWQVFMIYGGQRVDIVAVHGRERLAEALRDRLGQMDEEMDKSQAFGPYDEDDDDDGSRVYGARPGIG